MEIIYCDHCPATSRDAFIHIESGLCPDCLAAYRTAEES